ncbi:MAG: hypothetical protein HY754_15710, partial [Nitrospirae bacterium]|nr:hypothetical protein [Nitrospirota bacterium]
EKSRGHLSRLRQKIHQLREIRGRYIGKLLRPMPMIIGSLYEVYKTCSKPNCSCKEGEKHGPFPALSVSIKGKRSLKMVRKEDHLMVKEKAEAYQAFQQGLARVRKINKEIDSLLEKIKAEYLEEYK